MQFDLPRRFDLGIGRGIGADQPGMGEGRRRQQQPQQNNFFHQASSFSAVTANAIQPAMNAAPPNGIMNAKPWAPVSARR